MVAKVAIIFGFTPGASILAMMGSLTSSFVATSVGTFAANLLKMIPGFGTLFGGIINGVVGAGLTAAIGFSFSALFEEIFRRVLDGKTDTVSLEWMSQFLKRTFRGYVEKVKKGSSAGELE